MIIITFLWHRFCAKLPVAFSNFPRTWWSLLNCVLDVLTFLDHYLFSMWLCARMLEIFVCLRNWMFGALMSFHANVLCVLLCSRTLHAYVLGGLALVVGVLLCFLLYTSVVKFQKLLHEKAWIYCYIDCSFCILILIQFRKLHFGILHIYINFSVWI